VTRRGRGALDRRAALAAIAALATGLQPADALGQTAGVEVLATGVPGDGDDQLARALAEGLGTTRLTPRAIPDNVPRETLAFSEFLDGKRPRASLMVMGLSTIGALTLAGRGGLIGEGRPLARLIAEHQPIVVPEASPFRTLADLMAAITKNPGEVAWTGRARGSADHQLCIELTIAAGADPRRISYRAVDTSARASFEVLTGQAMVGTGALAEYVQQVRGGTLRALAVASPQRAPGFDTPTAREQGVDVAVVNWRGALTRDSVGRALIERFEAALDKLVQFSGWRQLLSQRHWGDLYLPGAEFERFVTTERLRVGHLLKQAGAT
jgi:putative tricarboxylic transport membrane protein